MALSDIKINESSVNSNLLKQKNQVSDEFNNQKLEKSLLKNEEYEEKLNHKKENELIFFNEDLDFKVYSFKGKLKSDDGEKLGRYLDITL